MTPHNSRLTVCLLASLLIASTASAQEDPFEAIVSNPDGAKVRLDDVSIPVRNPTGNELRQYLEAFRTINLTTSFTVDDGRGTASTNMNLPVGNSSIGPFRVPNGTKIRIKAGFSKKPGEKEGVLRTLEMIPSNPMSMGPVRFNKMVMDANGVIHMKLNLRLMGINFWPQEMTIEKIYRDREGNLMFKTGGTGLAGKFVPDMRITPDGRVQRYSRGIWLFGRPFAKWKDVKVDGEVAKLDSTLPINRWPPRATDILDWLPAPGAEGSNADSSIDALRPILDAIPVKDLSVAFRAKADRRRIKLSHGEGHLDLSNHEMSFDANGSFEGRTYKSDDRKPNGYRATATLTGEVDRPGLGKAKIDRVDLDLRGEHSEEIPFEDPKNVKLEATVEATARARLSDIDAGLNGSPRLKAPSGEATFDGKAKVTLRPNSDDEDAKRDITIDRDSNYGLTVSGPVTLDGVGKLGKDGVELPDKLVLVPADDPNTPDVDESAGPVIAVRGKLGTKMGFLFAKTDIDLHGKTNHRGAISVLSGEGANETEVSTTLRPGARVHMRTYAFAGMKEKTLAGGGVRITTDTRIEGTGDDTTIRGNGLEANLPTTDLRARVAANVRHGTRNGKETIVRSVAGEVEATLSEGEGTVSTGLPGAPRLTGRVAPGTRIKASTGRMIRSDPRGTVLETEGFSRGEKKARLEASLILTGGSLAHKDMALAFEGKTTVDLTATLGFRVDPKDLVNEPAPGTQPAPPVTEPIPMDLDLGVSFEEGSRLSLRQPDGEAHLVLTGATTFTARASVTVDPKTGKPTLNGLNGIDLTIEAESIDLKKLLKPMGAEVTARVGSRTTALIKNARVEFLERGLRITHDGIMIEIAAGAIEIGTGSRSRP